MSDEIDREFRQLIDLFSLDPLGLPSFHRSSDAWLEQLAQGRQIFVPLELEGKVVEHLNTILRVLAAPRGPDEVLARLQHSLAAELLVRNFGPSTRRRWRPRVRVDHRPRFSTEPGGTHVRLVGVQIERTADPGQSTDGGRLAANSRSPLPDFEDIPRSTGRVERPQAEMSELGVAGSSPGKGAVSTGDESAIDSRAESTAQLEAEIDSASGRVVIGMVDREITAGDVATIEARLGVRLFHASDPHAWTLGSLVLSTNPDNPILLRIVRSGSGVAFEVAWTGGSPGVEEVNRVHADVRRDVLRFVPGSRSVLSTVPMEGSPPG